MKAKKSKWCISVHDGFCEFSYEMKLSDKECIHSAIQKICAAFGVKKVPPAHQRPDYTPPLHANAYRPRKTSLLASRPRPRETTPR